MQQLLTTAQVADALGVTGSTVTRWVQSGHLPAAKLGTGRTSALIFNAADVLEFGDRLRSLAAERAA